jgi:sporulation and spore germination protein
MRGTLVAGLVALTVLAGCGLPDDDEPRLVAAEDAPLDLAPSTVPAAGAGVGDDSVAVFFINQDTGRLAAVGRPVPEPTPQAAIEQLLLGKAPDDPAALVSSIPPGTMLLDSRTEGETLILDLGPVGEGGLQGVAGQAQVQAFAQLVRTATGLSGIGDVRFLVGGVPIDAATEAGPSSEPVGRDDYPLLSPNGE